jgi:hypothetical protein
MTCRMPEQVKVKKMLEYRSRRDGFGRFNTSLVKKVDSPESGDLRV